MQPLRLLYNIFKFRNHFLRIPKSLLSTQTTKTIDYKTCYSVLNIPENSDQEGIRKAYLSLVKRYHPDSSSEEANATKFQEIDNAFRTLMDKLAKERWKVEEVEEEEEEDFKHVIPQHRQYLSNHGVGYGNPFQRQKQYTQTRAMQASENVMKHRIDKTIKEDKSLVVKKKQTHKIKTRYGFDRLVEDLIQEAISKGQFDNLSGTGKPLPQNDAKNPYVDFVTHKLNQVLIDNGFKPEWITLQQEIRIDIETMRKALVLQRANFSACPLSEDEFNSWKSLVEKHKQMAKDVNTKILKYNLLVPILQRQMLFVNLEKEARRILLEGTTNKDVTEYFKKRKAANEDEQQHSIFYTIYSMFFEKKSNPL